MKITEGTDKPKATFLRKSAFLTTGDSSFRFNFSLAPDELNSQSALKTGGDEPTQNTETNVQNSAEKVENTIPKEFKFLHSGSEFKFNFNVDNS